MFCSSLYVARPIWTPEISPVWTSTHNSITERVIRDNIQETQTNDMEETESPLTKGLAFKTAPKKRTTNFREDETKLLIQLWGNPTVQHKLYLTHGKAPVMRLIASKMQKHGFSRTPDEIKTRIRNLKCLYHRIKKSLTTGEKIDTIDLDWPHYKAIDEILRKKNALRKSLVYNQNLLSEVNSTDVEEELENIDINEDGESSTSNSNGSDDEFEETHTPFPTSITPTTPLIIEEEEEKTTHVKIAPKPVTPSPAQSAPPATFPRIQIPQNLLAKIQSNTQTSTVPQISQIQTVQPRLNNISSTASITSNAVPNSNGTLPFPLLILNGMSNGVQAGQNSGNALLQTSMPVTNSANGSGLTADSSFHVRHFISKSGQNGGNRPLQKSTPVNNNANESGFNAEVSNLLKEMLRVQKENLEIEKERLEVERQKLEFERTLGSQLINMVPAFNNLFQRFNKDSEPEKEDSKNFSEHPNFQETQSSGKKRAAEEDPRSSFKNPKVFKETVINGIRMYIVQEGTISNSSAEVVSRVTSDSQKNS